MTLNKIFVTRKIYPPALAQLEKIADVEVWPDNEPPSEKTIQQKITQLDGIITMLTDPITSSVLSSANMNLKVISQMAVGIDNIDINKATKLKIPIGHTPDVLTETCADFTWALMMSLARKIPEAAQEVKEGTWEPWGPDVLTGLDIHGAILGIIGLGRIGQAVARRAHGFNMKLLYTGHTRKSSLEDELGIEFCSLEDLLVRSDFISIHTYLTEETRHLIDKEQLAQMKNSALLINTARGGIVNPHALEWALKNNVIAGAALDVFEPEPIQKENPILKMKNVLITPHIASASIRTRQKMAYIAADNLIAGLEGRRLPFCANPQVYQD